MHYFLYCGHEVFMFYLTPSPLPWRTTEITPFEYRGNIDTVTPAKCVVFFFHCSLIRFYSFAFDKRLRPMLVANKVCIRYKLINRVIKLNKTNLKNNLEYGLIIIKSNQS